MTARFWGAAGVALLAALAGPAPAQEEQDLLDAEAFMLNNALFVFFHEVGHMFVSEFGLPVLGREEDAVDNLAAWLLLGVEEEWADQALVDAADGWYLSIAPDGQDDLSDDSYFMGAHSLNAQRSYAVVCLLAGHDAEGFAEVVEAYELPPEQVEACLWTYDQVSTSWGGLLEPHLLPEGAEPPPIEVIYDETAAYDWVREALMADGFLEYAAAVAGAYDLPRPVTFRATECGTPNAFWSPGDAEATLCYELAAFYHDLWLTPAPEGVEEGWEEAEAEEAAE